MGESLEAMFLRLDAEENGVAPQPVAPRVEAAPVPSAFQHSLDRAIERYGIYVRPQELVRVIESGSALLVGAGWGDDLTIYNVPVKVGREIVFVKVIYCRPMDGHRIGRIITVLPPESSHFRHSKVNNDRNAKTRKRFFRDLKTAEDADNDFVNEQIAGEAEP